MEQMPSKSTDRRERKKLAQRINIINETMKAFKENGIEFARKEVRVQLPEHMDSDNLSEDQKKVISAAASQAAEPDVAEGAKG